MNGARGSGRKGLTRLSDCRGRGEGQRREQRRAAPRRALPRRALPCRGGDGRSAVTGAERFRAAAAALPPLPARPARPGGEAGGFPSAGGLAASSPCFAFDLDLSPPGRRQLTFSFAPAIIQRLF